MLIVTLPLQGVLPKHLPPRADLTRAKKPRRAIAAQQPSS